MKKIALVVFVFALFSLNIFAQAPAQQNQQAQNQQAQNVVLKPKIVVEDLILAWQLLATVDLKANEVDAFLAVKTFLKPQIEKVQKDNMQITATIEFDTPLVTAQNMIQFLDRATIPAAQAEKFKRFLSAFQEAAKNYKP